jgi:hypothetical protein
MWRALAAIGVLAAVVTLLLTWVGSAGGCVGENVSCVEQGVYNTYQGRVFDYRGRPASNVKLLVSSPADQRGSSQPASTDGSGRFCIRAPAPDYGIDSIAIAGQRYAQDVVVRSSAPVDPRLADPSTRAALRKSNYSGPNYLPFVLTPTLAGNPSYYPQGAIPVSDLWNPRTDATQDCTTVASHALWWRSSAARSTWQFAALIAAPLAVIFMFLFAANRNRVLRRSGLETDPAAYRACATAAALNIVLFLSLWNLWGLL